jgi:hypothetical protein
MKINKNTQINIRLTNAEMQILKLKAKKKNISLSELIRKSALEYKRNYIHEIYHIYGKNGKIYMDYDSFEDEHSTFVFNKETLYSYLPEIITACIEQKKEMDNYTLAEIKLAIKKL